MRTSRTGLLTIFACSLAILASVPAAGQEPPAHYAITGVRIITGTGATIDGGTIVVNNGLIEAVGANVMVPDDAWIVDGTGMTAYPGLIDALTTLGLPAERRAAAGGGGFGGRGGPGAGQQDQVFATGPEDRPATFTWVSAADELETSDARIETWRNGGFTTAISSPERGLFPGQASVINLAGDRANGMVVATPVATRVTYTKGPGFGGYPASFMGSIAYLVQTFSDAAHYDMAWSVYGNDPAGLERPDYDRALEPLRAPLKDGQPVLFPGDWAREINRALRLSRQMGVSPIIYGGHQAWAVTDELAAANVSVLVNVDWPVKAADSDPEADEPLSLLRYRDRAPTVPAALQDAGVKFAFYSGGSANPAAVLRNVRLAVRAGLAPEAALAALTLSAAEIFGVDDRLGSIEAGKIANLLLADGDLFAAGTNVRMVVVDGHRFEVEEPAQRPGRAGMTANAEEEEGAYAPVPMAQDRGPVSDDAVLLIRGATVLTVSDAGTLTNADVLVRDGKIAAIGSGLDTPTGAKVIDASGKFVMPGIIDAHSHIASESTNEGAVAVSAMVGIRDVLDPDDLGIYRAAAGGVTSANVLHGSANPIGGQNSVIKMRWGSNAEGLLVEGAPPGIKFALGENTKRDRTPDRYPNSRMGVIDVIRQSFLEAEEYRERGRIYEQALADGTEGVIPPRRDLKLEALVEVLEGRRFVHAHSYRADEILQLLRTAEEFGFRIRTLQHVLEGYRVADEIAAHGAGASTFSDWWGYKVEAYEAIPHNAALMTERGVVVSINSDSGEEMRHLNQEAAKTVKWGGASEEDAIKMITLNPAIQLGIDDQVGSIEVGKDADLVVFEGHPLSTTALVLQTIIDGKVLFDREHDAQMRTALAEEKAMLVEKQKAAEPPARRGRPTAPGGEEAGR